MAAVPSGARGFGLRRRTLLARLLDDDARLLEQVAVDRAAAEHARGGEVQRDELAEAARVVVALRDAVAKALEHWIAAVEPA